MITALIRADGRIEPLAATLAALVPGVAEGLVADAVVIAAKHDAETAAVAEGVGAAHVVSAVDGEAWAAGAALARREWLLCLEAGGSDDTEDRGADYAFDTAGAAGVVAQLSGPLRRLDAAALIEALFGVSRARRGLVVHRTLLDRSGLSARLRPVRIGARLERPAF